MCVAFVNVIYKHQINQCPPDSSNSTFAVNHLMNSLQSSTL